MTNNVFLIEDHNEALNVWRKKGIRGLDLVHLDAHIDFGFFTAKPLDKLLKEAKSVKDLKKRLEHTLNFLHFEKDFNKQINIGNYIYPAIEEGFVNNFYWVVPGRAKEFKKARKTIKLILKAIIRYEDTKKIITDDKHGIISTQCLGRKFIVCTLDNLPIFTDGVLLDIDVDFLVIESILNAANIKDIGKRKPWIFPKALSDLLREKIKAPKVTTISYSAQGGWTPMKYKHFGDELACCLAPLKFKRRFEINQRAGKYFSLFEATGKKEYYQAAIRLNSRYRSADNNYGPLYFSTGRLSLAQKEFARVFKADSINPSAILGLGKIALQRKNFKRAKRYFYSAKKFTRNGLFKNAKRELLFNLAKVEFSLKDFKQAKIFLLSFRAQVPLEPHAHYLLGYIFEKEKNFTKAVQFYKDAIRLGFGSLEPILRLLKISPHLQEKNDIIKFVDSRYNEFKRGFNKIKILNSKKGKKIAGIHRIEKKMKFLEKKLYNKGG